MTASFGFVAPAVAPFTNLSFGPMTRPRAFRRGLFFSPIKTEYAIISIGHNTGKKEEERMSLLKYLLDCLSDPYTLALVIHLTLISVAIGATQWITSYDSGVKDSY
jgi:hypothetical protein